MKLDDKVCYCFHVSKRKIMNFLRVHQPRRASQLSECGGAGTGCGWCVRYLQKCFQDHVEGKAAEEDSQSVADYEAGRTEYIRAGKGTPRPGTGPREPEPGESGRP